MIENRFNPGFSARLAQGEAVRAALVDRARFAETSIGRVVEETSEADSRRFMRAVGVLSPVLATSMALTLIGLRPDTAFAQEIVSVVREYDQCGGTEGLEEFPPNVDVFVVQALMSDGTFQFFKTPFSINEECPTTDAASAPAPVDQKAAGSAEQCPPVTKIPVPGRHGEIQPDSLNENASQGRWFNPIYEERTANAANNWRGIGPWAPIAFQNVDAGAAELKTMGNLGHLVVSARNGGRVALAFWQQAQHQNETKMRPDGRLDPNWKNQYTFVGLGAFAPVTLFDPDTGAILNTWPDGSPINYTANSLGTAAFEVPPGEVRWGICFNMPTGPLGDQFVEVQVFRGPNDRPELRGENPLPSAVIKPGMPD